MDDALLKLKEPKMRRADRLGGRGKLTLDDVVAHGGPVVGLAGAAAAAKMGAFKTKQEDSKKKKDNKKKKDKDLTKTEGSFNKGGLVKKGKPKIAKKGWR